MKNINCNIGIINIDKVKRDSLSITVFDFFLGVTTAASVEIVDLNAVVEVTTAKTKTTTTTTYPEIKIQFYIHCSN